MLMASPIAGLSSDILNAKDLVLMKSEAMNTKLAPQPIILKKRKATKHLSSFEERYRLGITLGYGSSSEVTLCTDRFTHREFACKIMEKDIVNMDDFWTEISIMKSLSSPHIVSFVSAHEDADYVYLVMELCSGLNLLEKIEFRGSLPEAEAARIFVSLVQAVKHCHEKGVIHRDLKPKNILFKGSELKLADFGLSTYFPAPGKMLNEIVGSAYYIAPEVLCQSCDARADIWSLGLILYFMLSGEDLFDAATEEETLDMVRVGDFTTKPCWADISFKAQDLITKMLRMEPCDRLTLEEVMEHPWILNMS